MDVVNEASQKVSFHNSRKIPFLYRPMFYLGYGDFVEEHKPFYPDHFENFPLCAQERVIPVLDDKLNVLGYREHNDTRNIEKKERVTSSELEEYRLALESGENMCKGISCSIENTTLDHIAGTDVENETETEKEEEFVVLDNELDTKSMIEIKSKAKNLFGFECDDFQIRSFYRLDNRDMVFVSAPTSSGKTLVALYAIYLAKARNGKSVYTSPTKSLSNQKYHEFSIRFGEVGLLTGDISINRNASIVICTTEILRQLLLNDPSFIGATDVVIFDEFHYISDIDRGIVWEDSVMLMPKSINMVFLSATIPNAKTLCNWIGKINRRKVYLQTVEKRIIPLVHNYYTLGGNVSMINSGFIAATKAAKKSKSDSLSPKYLNSLVEQLVAKNYVPALVFVFSKKDTNKAKEITVDLSEGRETCRKIDDIFDKALELVPDEDKNDPEFSTMRNLAKRGIAVHHAGLVTVLREIVELLLIKGLVKIVFCTSTLQVGVNVPCKAAVFLRFTKFDGTSHKPLTVTEYVQMCGRAGRRGIDQVGHSIICLDRMFPKVNINMYKEMKSDDIESRHKLTLSMFVNILSMEESVDSYILKSITFDEVNSREKEVDSFTSNYEQIECIKPHFVRKPLDYDIENETDIAMQYYHSLIVLMRSCKVTGNCDGKLALYLENDTFRFGITENGKQDGEVVINGKTSNNYILFENEFTNVNPEAIQKKIEVNGLVPILDEDCDVKEEDIYNILRHPCLFCEKHSVHMQQASERYPEFIKFFENKRFVNAFRSKLKHVKDGFISYLQDKGYFENGHPSMKGQFYIGFNHPSPIPTEMIFNNLLKNKTEKQIPALISMFTKSIRCSPCKSRDDFDKAERMYKEVCRELERDFEARNISDEYESALQDTNATNFYFVDRWVNGDQLSKICDDFDVMAGDIVNSLRLLIQRLRNLHRALHIIGDTRTAEATRKSILLVDRGIVSIQSLYTVGALMSK